MTKLYIGNEYIGKVHINLINIWRITEMPKWEARKHFTRAYAFREALHVRIEEGQESVEMDIFITGYDHELSEEGMRLKLTVEDREPEPFNMQEVQAVLIESCQPFIQATVDLVKTAMQEAPPLATEDQALEIMNTASDLLKATLWHLLKLEGWTTEKAHDVRRKAGVSK